MIYKRFILSFLLKISDFIGYSLGMILPLRCIDSIRSQKLEVKRHNKTVFLMENYGPLSRKRARSFEFKEPETLTWIESFDSNDSLIDIGANIGIYTIYAAKRGHKVIAFEPTAGPTLLATSFAPIFIAIYAPNTAPMIKNVLFGKSP